jgi:hypothetical protein
MRKITKSLLTLLLLCVAGVANAATEYEIDQQFTDVGVLTDGQAFAILNETDNKMLYGSGAQNLGYADMTTAIEGDGNTGYYFKVDNGSNGAYCLRLQTPTGEPYTIWGNPGYLNSQPATGGCSFILGLNNQWGQDGENLALWQFEASGDGKFALKNVGTGLYLKSNAPANSETPVYFTLCTLKQKPVTDPLADQKDALAAAIAKGKMINAVAYTEATFAAIGTAVSDGEAALADATATAESLTNAATAIHNAIEALALKEGFTNLTADFFKHWDNVTAPTEGSAIGCAYDLFVGSGLPYGDGNVGYLNFANLSKYEKLYVTYASGTPRVMMNRDVDGGVWNEDETQSHLIEYPKTGWVEKYFTNEDGVVTVDLAQMVADKGYANLNAIKGANWANVTVTGLYLYKPVVNKNVFLKPGLWNVDGARYAAYVWDGQGDKWYDFAAAEEAGVYTAAVPDSYTGMILVRMNGQTTENNWDNKWNQTADIDFAAVADSTLFTITDWSAYETSKYVKAEPAPEPVLTLSGAVGTEVSLTFGVYDAEDTYSVDFGDGTLQTKTVGVNNAGPVDEATGQTVAATVFTGTVAGDGTIKVYGNNDIWYFIVSGDAMPTSFEQPKLMNVVQMTISGANAEAVALPAYEKLTQFSFTNSPVKSVDLSKVPSLTRIDIYNTTLSAFEPQLESIDVSQNVNLETIVLGGNTYKKGVLTALDFTNNTVLTQISAENNKIASVTNIPASVKNIYLSNNELESITFPEFVNKGTIQIQNNKFTLATLPTKPAITTTSKYTYAPQPAYKVAESVSELDLSSQLTATGVLTEPATTTYSFFAGENALVEGTDYVAVEPGKFKFLTEQSEKVHGVMATAAFPKFTGNNAYVTTEFTVVPVAGPTFDFENNNGNWAIGEGSDYAAGELTEENPITMDGITLTGVKGEAVNAVRYYTNASKGNCLWIFKNNSIKLTAPEGKSITKIEFTMQTGSFDLTPSKGAVVDNVWTGKAVEVTFGPNAKGTRYVYAINVTVEDGVPATYTLAGAFKANTVGAEEEASFFGEKWNPALDENLMEEQADGTYTITYDDVVFEKAGTIYFKVCENKSWDVSYGAYGQNAEKAVPEAGVYDLTFTFNPVEGSVFCTLVLDEIATGISNMNANTQKGQVYNLNGQQVMKAQKGLYIINGKKVVLK